MARLGRVVVRGIAHHVTQCGNRRQETFFDEEDYATYLALPSEWCGAPSEPAKHNGKNGWPPQEKIAATGIVRILDSPSIEIYTVVYT
jgi:hypothetical protein